MAEPAEPALLVVRGVLPVVGRFRIAEGTSAREIIGHEVLAVADVRRAGRSGGEAMTEIALHALEIVRLEIRDERRLRSAKQPGARRVTPNAEIAGDRLVLARDRQRRVKERIAGRVGHHRPLPRKVGVVIGVLAVAVVTETGRAQGDGQLVGLRSGLENAGHIVADVCAGAVGARRIGTRGVGDRSVVARRVLARSFVIRGVADGRVADGDVVASCIAAGSVAAGDVGAAVHRCIVSRRAPLSVGLDTAKHHDADQRCELKWARV